MAVLFEPVEFTIKVCVPIATLLPPVVLLTAVSHPTNVFAVPVVLARPALFPNKTNC